MIDNRRMLLTLVFIVIVATAIFYSFRSNPSLVEIRSAREIMRADMAVVRQECPGVVVFDDDRKAKVGSAILSIEIASDSWGEGHISKYESMLSKLGWIHSSKIDGGVFMCKKGASALLVNSMRGNEMNGYIYMKYPSDPRAKCYH